MTLYNRFAIVSSTSGSVAANVLMHDPSFRKNLKLLVTDRACGAEQIAIDFNIKHIRLIEPRRDSFSDQLLHVLISNRIEIVFLFFTRLVSGKLLEEYHGRIINLHPSLLPAFAGLRGFQDGWNSGCLVIGSTTHFIDTDIDTGPIIQQTMLPIAPTRENKARARHTVFLQQCASLSQVSDWIAQGRVRVGAKGSVEVQGADYGTLSNFIPALENGISKKIAYQMLAP
jgi:phosphoribosylglycinamide formyltransferase 1